MGYRFDRPEGEPEDIANRFKVRNGSTLRAAFACYYFKPHDPKAHDHAGWPNPDQPDMTCQLVLVDGHLTNGEIIPIDLVAEGYKDAAVAFEPDEYEDYVEAEAWIDQDDRNIVRMHAAVSIPAFQGRPHIMRFTVFARKPVEGKPDQIDAVCHGTMMVLPGSPFPIGG